MGAAYSSLGQNKVPLYCYISCESQILTKEVKCLGGFGRILTPFHIIRDSYTDIFC